MPRCAQVNAMFHGVKYIITVKTVQHESLCVEVEQVSDASKWRGDFTARCALSACQYLCSLMARCLSSIFCSKSSARKCRHKKLDTVHCRLAPGVASIDAGCSRCHAVWGAICYQHWTQSPQRMPLLPLPHAACTSADINDITSKTGNFKKYHVFVKMLVTALKSASESVFVDLLTYNDLEVLKAKRLRAAGHEAPPLQPNTAQSNKRYLILTYAAEFDRVHYPLPLMYEEYPDPVQLKLTIARLRSANPLSFLVALVALAQVITVRVPRPCAAHHRAPAQCEPSSFCGTDASDPCQSTRPCAAQAHHCAHAHCEPSSFCGTGASDACQST